MTVVCVLKYNGVWVPGRPMLRCPLRSHSMQQTWYKGDLFGGRKGSVGLEKGQRHRGNRSMRAEKWGQRRKEKTDRNRGGGEEPGRDMWEQRERKRESHLGWPQRTVPLHVCHPHLVATVNGLNDWVPGRILEASPISPIVWVQTHHLRSREAWGCHIL